MKIAFFNNINDLVLNKNDELKYLILYLDVKNKKNIINKYLNIWKITDFGSLNQNNLKKFEIEKNNINLIYRNKSPDNNKFKMKEQEHFSIEENLDEKSFNKEILLKEMKKYIIDFDEDLIGKETQKNFEKIKLIQNDNKNEIIEEEKKNIEENFKFNLENSISRNNNIKTLNENNKRSKTDDDDDKMEKYRKKFKALEEEYRIKYLLSSKNNINDNDAQNIINITQSINNAINNTKNSIHKIDEYELSKKNNNSNKNEEEETGKGNINVVIFDSFKL